MNYRLLTFLRFSVLLLLLLGSGAAQAQRIQNLPLLTNAALTNRIYIWSGDTNDSVKTTTLGNLMRSLSSNMPALTLTNATTSNVNWRILVDTQGTGATNAIIFTNAAGGGFWMGSQDGILRLASSNQTLGAVGSFYLVPTGGVYNAQTLVELYTRVTNGVATNLYLYASTTNQLGNATGTTNLDVSTASFFFCTNPIAGAVFYLTNCATNYSVQTITVAISNPIAGTYTISNTASPIRWTNGAAHPTVSTGSVDVFTLRRWGSNWLGTVTTNTPTPPP